MRRSKQAKEGRRRKRKAISGGPVRLASTEKPHADPSSASHSSNNNWGILRPDAERSADALKESAGVKPSALLPGRIMLTIMALALIFIAIITWFVSRMPAK
jgi:hypothetical protein